MSENEPHSASKKQTLVIGPPDKTGEEGVWAALGRSEMALPLAA